MIIHLYFSFTYALLGQLCKHRQGRCLYAITFLFLFFMVIIIITNIYIYFIIRLKSLCTGTLESINSGIVDPKHII